jgi:hypothetical protein
MGRVMSVSFPVRRDVGSSHANDLHNEHLRWGEQIRVWYGNLMRTNDTIIAINRRRHNGACFRDVW